MQQKSTDETSADLIASFEDLQRTLRAALVATDGVLQVLHAVMALPKPKRGPFASFRRRS
jgi:hypothetical protein